MPATLGNAARETTMRDAQADAFDARVNTGSGTATLRWRNGSTTLVTFNLSNPAFGASSSGTITLAGVPISATASAGTATVPDNYQILDRDGTLVASGAITTGDAITAGQTCTLSSFTHTEPA